MKLIQLNVERNKHLERWLPFLELERPDVVCLQEVMRRSLSRIERETGMQALFVPMCRMSGYEEDVEGDEFGVAILTLAPSKVLGEHYYVGSRETLTTHTHSSPIEERDRNIYKALLAIEAHDGRDRVVIATTHFTWTPDGNTSDQQRIDFAELARMLDRYPDLVLTGDFNIVRGTELYTKFSFRYADYVPQDVSCTTDPELHKKGVALVVDYIFATSAYRVSNVRVVGGLSDHKALIADIQEASV